MRSMKPFGVRARMTAEFRRIHPCQASLVGTENSGLTDSPVSLRRNWQGMRVHPSIASLEAAYAAFGIAWNAQLSKSYARLFTSVDLTYENRYAGTVVNQVGTLVVFAPALVLLFARCGASMRALPQTAAVWLAVLVPALSAAWSFSPESSFRRGLALILSVVFLYWCAIRFRGLEFLRLLAWTLGAIMVISLAAIAVPGLGIESYGPHVGDLRGILANKNDFGLMAAIACLTFVFLARMEQRSLRSACLAMAAVSFLLLLFANARSPLLALVAAPVAAALASFVLAPVGWQRRFTPDVRCLLALLVLVAGLASVFLLREAILHLVGRNDTLTGRVNLWAYASSRAIPHPMLGAGYRAFWGDDLTFDLRIRHAGWTGNLPGSMNLTSNGHNGYLDTWLELGLPGTIAIAGMFLMAAWRHTRLMRTDLIVGETFLAMLVMVAVYSLANSILFSAAHLAFALVLYPLFYSMIHGRNRAAA